MGIGVKTIGSGKDKGKYILTQSITDKSTEPLTRDQAITVFHKSRMHRVKLDLIKDFMSFPFMFGNGECQVTQENEEGYNEWNEWIKTAFAADDYNAFVDKKYDEIMKILEG